MKDLSLTNNDLKSSALLEPSSILSRRKKLKLSNFLFFACRFAGLLKGSEFRKSMVREMKMQSVFWILRYRYKFSRKIIYKQEHTRLDAELYGLSVKNISKHENILNAF